MNSHQVLILCLIALVLFILPSFGAYLMFRKAGRPGLIGLIPIVNIFVMLQVSKRPLYWFFLMFIPVVGWFISLGIYIEFVKTFGKFRFWQQIGRAHV